MRMNCAICRIGWFRFYSGEINDVNKMSSRFIQHLSSLVLRRALTFHLFAHVQVDVAHPRPVVILNRRNSLIIHTERG